LRGARALLKQVWVIGTTVGAALSGLDGIDQDRVILQPGPARRLGLWDVYQEKLRGLCQEAAKVAPEPHPGATS
jgi:hypothetical protein